jgi:hypothetical protein
MTIVRDPNAGLRSLGLTERPVTRWQPTAGIVHSSTLQQPELQSRTRTTSEGPIRLFLLLGTKVSSRCLAV